MKKRSFSLILVLIVLLASCAGPKSEQSSLINGEPQAAPTAHQLFAAQKKTVVAGQTAGSSPFSVPTLANYFEPFEPAKYPTATPVTRTVRSETRGPGTPARTVLVYTDWVTPGWEVLSPGDLLKIDTRSHTDVFSGSNAISIAPRQSLGKVFIITTQDNEDYYLRKDVLGVSFYLFSGKNGLYLKDLAFTVIGSNVFPYWRSDDDSVTSMNAYEEKDLSRLGFNNFIPADTWVRVEIWLDDMQYDPDYHFVTGMYINPRKGFGRSFAIDEVSLIVR
jgi:hypothetical protein